MEVLIEGYESGFDSIYGVKIKSLARYAAAEDWDGEFDESPDAQAQEMLVILGRRDNRRREED